MIDKREVYIQTCKGRRFYPYAAEKSPLDIEEIAQSLATQARWRGQWKPGVEFYSVAQHSVYVSRLASRPAKKWGLLHDSPEWVIGDWPSPIKKFFPDVMVMEATLEQHTIDMFGLEITTDIATEIHNLDQWVALQEANALLTDPSLVTARTAGSVVHFPGRKLRIIPWSPSFAKAQFLLQFKVLTDAEQQAV